MKRFVSLLVLSALILVLAGCAAHTHIVGNGAQGNAIEKQRQWYVLWGLVPINNIDTKTMAGNAVDYTIKTEQSFVDIVIGFFTGIVTVGCRSVTVTK